MLAVFLTFLGLFASPAPDTRPHITRVTSGRWTYELYADGFTALRACRLYSRRMSYGRDTLTFHLGERTRTYDAIYRVDGGPPQTEAGQRTVLVRNGVELNTDSLANPSGGLVHIPAGDVLGARSVTIRADPRGLTATFDLRDFDKALRDAKAAGCPPDRFYG